MARKLWLAAVVQGHREPFGRHLTDYTVAQLDFVLEMAAINEPDRYVFTRAGVVAPSVAMAAWNRIAVDGAKVAMEQVSGKSRAMAGLAKWREGRTVRGGGMALGLTKGGKPLETGIGVRNAGDKGRG